LSRKKERPGIIIFQKRHLTERGKTHGGRQTNSQMKSKRREKAKEGEIRVQIEKIYLGGKKNYVPYFKKGEKLNSQNRQSRTEVKRTRERSTGGTLFGSGKK